MIKNSDKLSCCSRGATWFKNCGDLGDTKFDHTWADGIGACEGFASSVSVKVEIHHMGIIMYPPNISESRNVTHHQKNINCVDSIFDTGTTNFIDCDRFVKVVVGIYLFGYIYHSLLTDCQRRNVIP